MHDGEDRRLHALLKRIEEEEAERLRLLKLWEEQNVYYEHYAEGEVDLNQLTDADLDRLSEELFRNRPIPFMAKKGENYDLEHEIERQIKELNVTIPICHVKGQIYLIGTQKLIIKCSADKLVVRVGGGYQQFSEYILQN